MRISERVDNAVRAMAELAAGDGTPMKAETISRSQDISLKYLLDILRDLKRGELVRSKRGPDGGFSLSRPAKTISLADIFRAIDGPLADVHDTSLRGLEYPPPAEALPKSLCPDGSPASLWQVSSEEPMPGESAIDGLADELSSAEPPSTDNASPAADKTLPQTPPEEGGEQ